MFCLSREKYDVFNSWQYSYLKIVLEGLIPLLIIFHPSSTWEINDNIWCVG
jgi:hypothetical protein